MKKEEALNPTAYLESIMLTSVIYTKEDRDVATIYIPNFSIQTLIDRKPVEDKITTKIKGVLVDILVLMDLEKYGPNVVY